MTSTSHYYAGWYRDGCLQPRPPRRFGKTKDFYVKNVPARPFGITAGFTSIEYNIVCIYLPIHLAQQQQPQQWLQSITGRKRDRTALCDGFQRSRLWCTSSVHPGPSRIIVGRFIYYPLTRSPSRHAHCNDRPTERFIIRHSPSRSSRGMVLNPPSRSYIHTRVQDGWAWCGHDVFYIYIRARLDERVVLAQAHGDACKITTICLLSTTHNTRYFPFYRKRRRVDRKARTQ